MGNHPSENAVDGVAGNSGNKADHFGEHNELLVTSKAEAEARKDLGQKWGDIIPPVPPFHDGLNWTPAGQAILKNGCNFPPVVTTTQPPSSTTQPPSSTTQPPSSTTQPPPPTTTPPPTTKAPTTTTKAPTTTTKAPPPPSTKAPTTTTKAPTTTTKAPTTTTQAPPPVTLVRVEPPKPGAPLAFTGSDTGRIAGIALLMIGIGFVLMSRYRRPQLLTVGTSTNAPAFRSARKRDGQPLVPVDETMHDGGVDADEESLTSLWVQAHEAIDLLNKWIATTRRRDEE